MDKTIRDNLLGTLADVNELISDLESTYHSRYTKEEAAEALPRLLSAYELRVKVLQALQHI